MKMSKIFALFALSSIFIFGGSSMASEKDKDVNIIVFFPPTGGKMCWITTSHIGSSSEGFYWESNNIQYGMTPGSQALTVEGKESELEKLAASIGIDDIKKCVLVD